MIGSNYDIELDGTAYHLAEDARGDHHQVSGEPLRPPNAVTVQGESQQKFQVRPDVLLWNWTNWDEGEGRNQWVFGESGRSFELNGVRAFEKNGVLRPGYYLERTQDSTGASDFTYSVTLVRLDDTLFGIWNGNNGNSYYFTWDDVNEKWSTYTVFTGPSTNPGGYIAVSDGEYIFWATSSGVWKWDTTTSTATSISGTVTTADAVAESGAYVYAMVTSTGVVTEIAKTGSSETEIADFDGTADAGGLLSMDGLVYAYRRSSSGDTIIYAITPTSAAGTGYGAERGRILGFRAEAMWAHSGTLYFAGSQDSDSDESAVMYWIPGQTYGTLGSLREGETIGGLSGGAERMLDHFVVGQKLHTSDANNALVQVDAITGGMGVLAYDEGAYTNYTPLNVVAHLEDIFWSDGYGVFRARKDQFTTLGYAISPMHDFDLLSDKFLGSITLSCQNIEDWEINVYYQTDEDGTWTQAINYTAAGDGTTATISTDASTVFFRLLRLKVEFDYVGSGVPTTAPEVYGVEVRAGVADKVTVTTLMVDLNDHESARDPRKGSSKASTFRTTCEKNTVVDFKDGYLDRTPGQYTQSDVVVDAFTIMMDRPGEGVGMVKLREVF